MKDLNTGIAIASITVLLIVIGYKLIRKYLNKNRRTK